MPIYEYRCRQCSHQFERLVRHGEQVTCPECSCPELQRLFGTFGIKDPGRYLDRQKVTRLADRMKRQTLD
jgi:putative FmdB family regulatory protein